MSDRKEELRKALHVEESEDGGGEEERETNVPFWKRTKTLGSGRWKTKINWGTVLVIVGFILFLITWFIFKPMTGGT